MQKKELIKTIFFELFFFIIVFFLGFYSAIQANEVLINESIEIPEIGFKDFLFYFFFATAFILLIIYIPKVKKYRAWIYNFLFVFSFIYGSLMILPLFLPDIVSLPLILILIFLWFKQPRIIIHDILIVLALAGIGSIFGLAIEPRVVVLILLVLSIYDFVAVYKTKHMVKMAGSMLNHGVIMGIVVPQKIKDFKSFIKEVKPGGKFMVLGGGDIIFPLIFSISMLDKGLFPSLLVGSFSLLGLIVSLLIFLFQKDKKPIPALPPIALFSIIGYIITLL